jgi:hypothetical protein
MIRVGSARAVGSPESEAQVSGKAPGKSSYVPYPVIAATEYFAYCTVTADSFTGPSRPDSSSGESFVYGL